MCGNSASLIWRPICDKWSWKSGGPTTLATRLAMAMLATRTIAWVRNILVPQGIPPPRLLINFVRGATPGAA